MFTGHRDLDCDIAKLKVALHLAIEELAAKDVLWFACGGARGFDLLAGEAVIALREKIPQLKLYMILPHKGQERSYTAADKARYSALLQRADRVVYLAEKYYTGCLLARDRVMVEGATRCIAYLTHSGGGTAYTVRYAAIKDIPIINLANAL